MKEYFQLQLKLSNRKLREIGIHSVFAVLLVVLLLIFSSVYYFDNSSCLPYLIGFILVLILFIIALLFGGNHQLKYKTEKHQFLRIRILRANILSN